MLMFVIESSRRWSSRSCGEQSDRRKRELRRLRNSRADALREVQDVLEDRQLSPHVEHVLLVVAAYLSRE